MKLSQAKRRYRNQWIAFRWSNRNKKIGSVILHDPDREQFDSKLFVYTRKKKLNGAYLTYTGPKSLIPKNGVIILCMK